MKKHLPILLALLMVATAATAQIQLIGLNYDPIVGNIDVTRWDAATGAVLNSVPTTANGAVSGSAVHDAYSGKYYFRSPSNLVSVGFSPDTVATLALVELATSAEIDMANGKIFAVQPIAQFDSMGTYLGSDLVFLEYNIVSGMEIVLGNIPNNEGVLLDASAYNSNTGTYYFLGIDSALGLSLYSVPTRAAQFSVGMVAVNAGNMQMIELEYDNLHDLLYALVFDDMNNPPSNLQLHLLDPVLGNLTLEADFPALQTYVSGTSCFDNTSGSYLFQGGDSLNVFAARIYNTLNQTLVDGPLPYGNLSEFQCDNSEFAIAKYGAVAAVDPAASALIVYPNPANGLMVIASEDKMKSLAIMDLQGRIVERQAPASARVAVDVAGYAPGIYFALLTDAAGQVERVRFVVQ